MIRWFQHRCSSASGYTFLIAPQMSVADDERDLLEPSISQIAQHRRPTWRRFSVAGGEAENHLAPVAQGGDHHQEAGSFLLQTGFYVHPVNPHIRNFQILQ